MKIENLKQVTELQSYREALLNHARTLLEGNLLALTCDAAPDMTINLCRIDQKPILAALSEQMNAEIKEIDDELISLGVEFKSDFDFTTALASELKGFRHRAALRLSETTGKSVKA